MTSSLCRPGAFLAVAALGALFASGCESKVGTETEENGAENAATPALPLPVVERPMGRARLLLTVVRAASSHAIGHDDSATQRLLDGKQFELRIRFGCSADALEKNAFKSTLDPEGETLRLNASPNLSLNDKVVRELAGANVEAVEGFWMARPWLLEAACPVRRSEARPDVEDEPSDSSAVPPTGSQAESSLSATAPQRIGIAQFFEPDDSRTHRRPARPFETVIRLEPGEQASKSGFDFVLAGRIRAFPNGRVVLCYGGGVERPPDCVISADFDRAWIERSADKHVLAEWSI